ncbi:MAG: winged helix DNA-binding domain-containing protein [Chloroflexi bacterium]|nr:winged helix DNA-binding domain-containing protein [Chloroflexota bacterium]
MTRREATPPAATVGWDRVLALRLERQHIATRTTPDRLVDVVSGLVGLHAQVMSSAELQLAARIDGLRASDVREALWEARRLVKVWAFRQTLHVLTPDDLVAFVAAARSLERWHTPAWLRYFHLTEADVAAMIDAVGAALSERPMARADLVAAVTARLGRPELAEAMLTGWGTFLAPAAQHGRLVFGPSEGRNVAFVNPARWLGRPVEPSLDQAAADEALSRLIVRYLAAFPGATREMVARWWGGGRMSAINRALGHVETELAEVELEGARALVRRADAALLACATATGSVRLLPGFDPFTNELPRRVETVLARSRHELIHRTAGWVTPIVVVDGAIGGTWEIAGGAKTSKVDVVLWARLAGGARKELATEVDRIAAFLDRPLSISVGVASGAAP